MNKKIQRNRRKKTKAPMFVLLAMILIVIGIIATIFSFFLIDDMNQEYVPSFMESSKITSSETSSDILSDPDSDITSAVTSSEENSSSNTETTSSDSITLPPDATVLGETPSISRDYFDDAIFVGDSISKGLKLYGVLPASNVIADQNVGLDQIANDKPVYYTTSGEKRTLFQMLQNSNVSKKKIYLLLGSNGLPHYDNDKHIQYYETVLDRVMETYPDATIILQSVTPITKQAEADYKKRNKDFTNIKINDFNEKIKKLAEEKGVYYLDIREALVDDNGYLSSEYSGGDGVHFKKNGHEAMYQYYKTHVPVKYYEQEPSNTVSKGEQVQ